MTAIRLRAAGYSVETVFDGLTALTVASADPPDAILLDIRMPNIDGFAIHSRIKAEPALASCPVIFLSACMQEHARRKAFAAGAAAFLPKPYEMRNVLAAIERACAHAPNGHASTEPSHDTEAVTQNSHRG